MGIIKRRKQPHLFRDSDQHPGTTPVRSKQGVAQRVQSAAASRDQTSPSGRPADAGNQTTAPKDGESSTDDPVSDEG